MNRYILLNIVFIRIASLAISQRLPPSSLLILSLLPNQSPSTLLLGPMTGIVIEPLAINSLGDLARALAKWLGEESILTIII